VRELALHLLDIAENSVAAHAKTIVITVVEDTRADRLFMSVKDDGIGMDTDTVARVIDPFYTTRTTRKVGLGIPLLKEAAEACCGGLQIHSTPGAGTLIEVDFQRSNIDRMPLGDLPGTFLSMLISSPDIHWVFVYRSDDQEYKFDDSEIKQILNGVPLTEPTILSFLRENLTYGVENIQPKAG
jgi:hypothetical protein